MNEIKSINTTEKMGETNSFLKDKTKQSLSRLTKEQSNK